MGRKKSKDSYHHGDLETALVDAAVEVLAERGLSGLSLRECARRVGVSHAAPYRHFADKDALIRAVAEQGFARLEAAGREAMEGIDDPRDRIDAYGVAYVQFAIDHSEHHRVMFAGEGIDEEHRDEMVHGTGAFGLLVECAAELVDDDTEPELAAVAFWSLVHGLSMLILDGRIPAELLETAEQVEFLTRNCYATWRATA